MKETTELDCLEKILIGVYRGLRSCAMIPTATRRCLEPSTIQEDSITKPIVTAGKIIGVGMLTYHVSNELANHHYALTQSIMFTNALSLAYELGGKLSKLAFVRDDHAE